MQTNHVISGHPVPGGDGVQIGAERAAVAGWNGDNARGRQTGRLKTARPHAQGVMQCRILNSQWLIKYSDADIRRNPLDNAREGPTRERPAERANRPARFGTENVPEADPHGPVAERLNVYVHDRPILPGETH